MRRITAVVADTNSAGRALCEGVLQHQEDIVVVAHVARYDEAMAAAVELKPRVLLCSRRFAFPANYLIFESLRKKCPSTLGILWADGVIEEGEIIAALAKGALGFVDRSNLARELPEAIRRISDGEAWVRRRVLGAIHELLVRERSSISEIR